jgi:hypothetical protein
VPCDDRDVRLDSFPAKSMADCETGLNLAAQDESTGIPAPSHWTH